MAVSARDAAARVNALVPQLELGVLSFEHRGARLLVFVVDEILPVRELGLVPVGFDVGGGEPFAPGERERHL
jgi:hypothetical protein